MFQKLKESGCDPMPVQYRFNGNHPDLTKIDKLLAEMSYIDKSKLTVETSETEAKKITVYI